MQHRHILGDEDSPCFMLCLSRGDRLRACERRPQHGRCRAGSVVWPITSGGQCLPLVSETHADPCRRPWDGFPRLIRPIQHVHGAVVMSLGHAQGHPTMPSYSVAKRGVTAESSTTQGRERSRLRSAERNIARAARADASVPRYCYWKVSCDKVQELMSIKPSSHVSWPSSPVSCNRAT